MNPPGDIIEFFGQRMRRDWAEALQAAQEERTLVCESENYAKIAYGDETFRDPVESSHGPCRHCGTIKGKVHTHACDYEQCPRCNYQMMSCDCEFAGHKWRTE
jgi:hypothetical protein